VRIIVRCNCRLACAVILSCWLDVVLASLPAQVAEQQGRYLAEVLNKQQSNLQPGAGEALQPFK
jgi:hypothetical protein